MVHSGSGGGGDSKGLNENQYCSVDSIGVHLEYIWTHKGHDQQSVRPEVQYTHYKCWYCPGLTLKVKILCCLCFNIYSISSGLCAVSFSSLSTHHLFGWHCHPPMTAPLWKLSRWLLHIRPDLPVALAKPMLTVGLFHSLILKSCFGPPPTQQNTPCCPRTWSGNTTEVSEVG